MTSDRLDELARPQRDRLEQVHDARNLGRGRTPVGVARLVRLGGLHALPLGVVAGGEALTDRRGPARGRDRDLRLKRARRRRASRVHVGTRRGAHGHRPRARHRGLREAVGGRRRTQVGPGRRQPPSLFRLYRAAVSEHYVLIPGRDPERGSGVDRREQVNAVDDAGIRALRVLAHTISTVSPSARTWSRPTR